MRDIEIYRNQIRLEIIEAQIAELETQRDALKYRLSGVQEGTDVHYSELIDEPTNPQNVNTSTKQEDDEPIDYGFDSLFGNVDKIKTDVEQDAEPADAEN